MAKTFKNNFRKHGIACEVVNALIVVCYNNGPVWWTIVAKNRFHASVSATDYLRLNLSECYCAWKPNEAFHSLWVASAVGDFVLDVFGTPLRFRSKDAD